MTAGVSVVIPTRNRSELLRRAVESVRHQTEPVDEIIVVDDASGSAHAEAVAELEGEKENVRVIRLAERRGGSVARNVGWRAAATPLVAFLDDDDTWMPSKVERQRGRLVDAGEGWSWTAYRLVDARTGRVRSEIHPNRGDFRRILRRSALVCSTLMVRRSLLRDIEGFDEILPRNQDWDLFLRLSRSTEGVYVDEVLTEMRYHVPDPEACVRGRRLLMQKWEEEIDALGPWWRNRVLAEHHWLLWANYAQMGNWRSEVKHVLVAVLRMPLNLRYLRSLLLTVLHGVGWRAARPRSGNGDV